MADQSDYDDKTVLIASNTKANTVKVDEMGTVVQQPTVVQEGTVVQQSSVLLPTEATEKAESIQERLGISEITAMEGKASELDMSQTTGSSHSIHNSEADVEQHDDVTRVILPGFAQGNLEKDAIEESVMGEASEVRESSVLMGSAVESGPVVGWLVVVEGPGRGNSRQISYGNNTIGRSASQRIPLNFGDDTISGEEQAYIQYHHKSREFLFVPNLAKPNVVEVNETNPVSPVVLNAHDIIRMGETSLLFVPLCGSNFEWNDTSEQ